MEALLFVATKWFGNFHHDEKTNFLVINTKSAVTVFKVSEVKVELKNLTECKT